MKPNAGKDFVISAKKISTTGTPFGIQRQTKYMTTAYLLLATAMAFILFYRAIRFFEKI